MTEQIADTGAQEPVVQPDAKEEDPFKGFVQEEYERGEQVKAPEPKEPASEEPPKDEEGDKPKDEGEKPPKPRQTAQERIDELTAARRAAEREVEALRRQLEERQAPPKPEAKGGDPAPVEGEKPAEEGPKPPNPEDFDFGELDPAYLAAVVDYRTDQRLAKYEADRKAADEKAEAARRAYEEQLSVQERFKQRAEEGAAKYPDFEEKVLGGAEEGTWLLSGELASLIVESDVGADIAYHLASNPEEAAKVFRQSPLEQARFFGRMESKFSAEREAASSGNAGSPAPAKTPQAPPPVPSARGASGRFESPVETTDFAAFERRAMGEL